MPSNGEKKDIKKNNKSLRIVKKYNVKWILMITVWTFLLAISVSLISESVMRTFDILMASVILLIIVNLGVVFDIIGIAVAASDERPFHSMAANKIPAAIYAIKLVRNAGPVSNFCNDVIGDIAGIISGAAGTIIVIKLVDSYGIIDGAFLSVVMSGLIASITVGGKAIGKEIAIRNSKQIIFKTAKVFMILHTKFGINLLPDLKKKRRKVDD